MSNGVSLAGLPETALTIATAPLNRQALVGSSTARLIREILPRSSRRTARLRSRFRSSWARERRYLLIAPRSVRLADEVQDDEHGRGPL